MSEQYFQPAPQSGHDLKVFSLEFAGRSFSFETDAGVFSRDGLDEGTALLLDTVLPDLHGRVLDLGCGWGPAGIIALGLKPGLSMVFTDINARAAGLTRRNLARNGLSGEVFTGDGLERVDGLFDWVLLNPPIRAGKQAVYRLFAESAGRLNPGGRLALVIRKQQGALSARDFLVTVFDDVLLKARKKGYHVYVCGRNGDEV